VDKKTVRDVDLEGKRVLVRVDFNVPLENGEIQDDTRIRASLDTIRYLLEKGAGVALCSHLGRPGGEPRDDLRLDPAGKALAQRLDQEVKKLNDCVGQEVEAAAKEMDPGEVILLENTRFHAGEKKNDRDFARSLSAPFQLFVNDAFAAAHRAHASTAGVAEHLPAVAGLLMEREVETLKGILENPEDPFVLIMGGAKISDKLPMLGRFRDRVHRVLTGGGIANTLLEAKGVYVGDSLVEEESLEDARSLLEEMDEKLLLPRDVVVARGRGVTTSRMNVRREDVPEAWMILDVGEETIQDYQQVLAEAATILWNGPMGLFEEEVFRDGTFAMARTLAELGAKSITGGGETAAAVAQAGVVDGMTHVSTGGGAFLEFMQGETLPGIAALDDR